MSAQPDAICPGTRFRLFPQPPMLAGFAEPETVCLSPPAGSIGAGPADDRMGVVDAIAKLRPYEYPYLPPYDGETHAPVTAGPDGHFNHLPVDSREFRAAHMYGTLRFVLDVWEGYLGGPFDWHFGDDYQRLELVPSVDWNNAQAGWGFIETGYRLAEGAERVPLSLNFDVLAHELGHALLYSVVGLPPDGVTGAGFVAFHESAADLVAIVSALHFDSVRRLVLERTSGNLFLRNVLNRIGEVSPNDQIRLASNRLRMADVADPQTPVATLSQPERHRMGEPLTGAVFDALVEVFQQNLVDRGLISPALDERSRRGGRFTIDDEGVQRAFDEAYRRAPAGFDAALVAARDYLGSLLARTWRSLSWDLGFGDVGRALLRADGELTGGYFQREILESLVWREIGSNEEHDPQAMPMRRRAPGRPGSGWWFRPR